MTTDHAPAHRAIALESVLRILLAHRWGRRADITRQAARDLIRRIRALRAAT